VCDEKGLLLDDVVREIASVAEVPPAGERDWATEPMADLVAHIVGWYHVGLRSDLPRIDALLEKVSRTHGEAHGRTLGALQGSFRALRAELESHLEKEEQVLFPCVRELEQAARGLRRAITLPLGLAGGACEVMEREHETAGLALGTMRRVTGGYLPPPDACTSFRALYTGLESLEADLHRHIHLENNVLFERARAAERRLMGEPEPTR
jgi:regulator of cell morphogenesis and NO signaling